MNQAINMLEHVQEQMTHYSAGHLSPKVLEESVLRKMESLRESNKKIPEQLYNIRKRQIKPSEYVLHENEEEGQNSYLVLEGNFQVQKTVNGDKVPMFDLYPGDLLAFFPGIHKVRLGFDLCAQTKTAGSLVILDRELFLNLARANHILFNSLFESILLNLYLRLTMIT